MSGIYYALSIVAVFIVIQWFIRNDNKKPDESTTGLLAMRGPENQLKPSSQPSPRSPARVAPNPNEM
jgi:hypothetical protein